MKDSINTAEKIGWRDYWKTLDCETQMEAIRHIECFDIMLLKKHWLIRVFKFPMFFLKHYSVSRNSKSAIDSIKYGFKWALANLFPSCLYK